MRTIPLPRQGSSDRLTTPIRGTRVAPRALTVRPIAQHAAWNVPDEASAGSGHSIDAFCPKDVVAEDASVAGLAPIPMWKPSRAKGAI
jgi:hypothetical protein